MRGKNCKPFITSVGRQVVLVPMAEMGILHCSTRDFSGVMTLPKQYWGGIWPKMTSFTAQMVLSSIPGEWGGEGGVWG